MQLLKWLSLKLELLGYRIELIQECQRLVDAGRIIPRNYLQLCFGSPARYDDFINFLCFLGNKKVVNLIDIGADVGGFSKDFLTFFRKSQTYSLL